MLYQPHKIEQYRVVAGPLASDSSYQCNGAFQVPSSTNGGAKAPKRSVQRLNVVASDGEGWDHVSVSLHYRCPTWGEMCYVKSLFFGEEEAVIQYHPPKSAYVNCHEFCLHMWRPQNVVLPLPPSLLVGPQRISGNE